MSYRALENMQKINAEKYSISKTVNIPAAPTFDKPSRCLYGKDAVDFLRDKCTDLKFDPELEDLTDEKGRSIKKEPIPYNMARDLDRLCFERAIARFLKSGAHEDAFDIYFCYCEIFHPFGGGYEESGILFKMLSEHETNASSLMNSHRDHFAHSVYVFCMGLSIYMHHHEFRKAYHKRFGLDDDSKAACHFLEWWGLTSLFHDIGYPYEIAHQQMDAFAIKLLGDPPKKDPILKTRPYISYNRIDRFFHTQVNDPNEFYAKLITDRLSTYLQEIKFGPEDCLLRLAENLKDRPIHAKCERDNSDDCYYMDHGYFSGLLLLKTYLDQHPDKKAFSDQDDKARLDSFCAIILHNSLFKHTIQKFNDSNRPLHLNDGQPLAYLLMLCDELQCWDRTCYGETTRRKVYPYRFEMTFSKEHSIELDYHFDDIALQMARKDEDKDIDDKKTYTEMDNGEFWKNINKIVLLKDVIPDYGKKPPKDSFARIHKDTPTTNQNQTERNLSSSSYLNLYKFALALHAVYLDNLPVEAKTEAVAKTDFEKNLSLEYKLSNIAQAKGYAAILDKIDCFYTDRPIKCRRVTNFSLSDTQILHKAEHIRWCKEKGDMGWRAFPKGIDPKDYADKREHIRLHGSLVPYEKLTKIDINTVSKGLNEMLLLLQQYDGLTIYKL